MKLILIILTLFGSLAANAQNSDVVENIFAKGPQKMTCDAFVDHIYIGPTSKGKVEINLDMSDSKNPLVTLKSKNKELNFKIGQGNYSNSYIRSDDVCESRYIKAPNGSGLNALLYVCLDKFEMDGINALTKMDLSSQLVLSADQSEFVSVCKGRHPELGCYRLSNCK